MYFKAFLLYFLFHQSWATLMELTCSDIREFVDGHNLRRLRIVKGEVYNQPPASGMKYMTWDNELAKKAAEWASKYPTDTDSDETIESDRFLINQNILVLRGEESYLDFSINKVLNTWFDKNEKYSYTPYTFYGPEVGDYLRMVRAKTRYIGCGISYEYKSIYKTYYVVCNYGPSDKKYKADIPYYTGSVSDSLECDSDECKHPYGYTCSQ